MYQQNGRKDGCSLGILTICQTLEEVDVVVVFVDFLLLLAGCGFANVMLEEAVVVVVIVDSLCLLEFLIMGMSHVLMFVGMKELLNRYRQKKYNYHDM